MTCHKFIFMWKHKFICNMLGCHRSKLTSTITCWWMTCIMPYQASWLLPEQLQWPVLRQPLVCATPSESRWPLRPSSGPHPAPDLKLILVKGKSIYQETGHTQTWMHLWNKRTRDGSDVATGMVLLHLQVSWIIYVTPRRTSWELDASLQAYFSGITI